MAHADGALSLDVSPDLEKNDLGALRDWVRAFRIDEIECVTPDLAGIARGKVMPAAKFLHETEMRLPSSMFFATINGSYAGNDRPELHTDPDLVLTPDLSTARAVPWAADRSLQIIHDVFDGSGAPSPVAPREVLRRVCALYAERGWQPLVAPEIEFYLTKPNTDPDYPLEPPVGRSGRTSLGNQAFSISAVDEFDRVVALIYDYADAQSLSIDTIIQEAGAAQMEINTYHGHPVDLADRVFFFKRLIREAALRCDTYATFMAKPHEDQPGSAMHIHLSVTDRETGANIFSAADGSASPAYDHFIGGQQAHFYAATALIAPYVNSYRRLVPGWAAPINLDWGVENRSTGLRAPRSAPEARRVENRLAGADANPYLAIAACLAAGYLGLTQRTAARPEVTDNAYTGRRELPPDLLSAIEALGASAPLREVLGDPFVDTFVAVKREEHEQFMRVISPWEREHLLLNV
ncbi:MAG: glutamine synthetase family protein [Pseudomonadota bacterium]